MSNQRKIQQKLLKIYLMALSHLEKNHYHLHYCCDADEFFHFTHSY